MAVGKVKKYSQTQTLVRRKEPKINVAGLGKRELWATKRTDDNWMPNSDKQKEQGQVFKSRISICNEVDKKSWDIFLKTIREFAGKFSAKIRVLKSNHWKDQLEANEVKGR